MTVTRGYKVSEDTKVAFKGTRIQSNTSALEI